MALDRRGRPVGEGDQVRFAEIDHDTEVTAIAASGIYIDSPLLGRRFVADSDRCFEVVEPAEPAGR